MNLSFLSPVNRTDWALLPRGGNESEKENSEFKTNLDG